MRHMKPKTTAEAHTLKINAARLRHNVKEYPDHNPGINRMDRLAADFMDERADALLTLPVIPACGTGGELAPLPSMGLIGQEDAVKRPGTVALNASIDRVSLADNCGVFNLAFDTAETIGARDATEQMLAHQMAAAHKTALDLLAKSATQRDTVEQARLVNAAARLMDTYQKAMLTINRIRTGGRQLVTVQHVNVGAGGQAVIGNVQAGGGLLQGEVRKNG